MKAKMNFKIDQNYSSNEKQYEAAKAARELFKSQFTAEDLLRMFSEEFDYEQYIFCDKILSCDIEIGAVNSITDDMFFMVDISAMNSGFFKQVHFFINWSECSGFAIDDDELLRSFDVYMHKQI